MDTKVLMDLFHIPAQSGQEKNVQKYIISYLTKHGIEFDIDKKGNIYNISNDGKPLLSAHMDTVQDNADEMFAKFIEIKDDIVKGYGVIGGDDKCGIYVILDLLVNGHEDVNFLFSVQEETGGIGSNYFVQEQNLGHIPYGLVLDRMGGTDILCENHDYGTPEFEHVLLSMGIPFGFSVGYGTFSDADYLSDQISCANISVGYHNAHTKHEYVVLSELQNTINFVHSVISYLDINFDAPDKKFSYGAGIYGNYGTYGNYQHYGESGTVHDYTYDEFDDYGLSNTKEIPYCDVCGREPGTKYSKVLSSHLCPKCANDLLWELEGDIYDNYDTGTNGIY